MVRGLYTSGWSMLALQKKMDVITNNMANVNTNGYKKDTVVFEGFPSVFTKITKDFSGTSRSPRDIGTMELGNDVGQVFTYYTQGQLIQTNNELDLALKNSGSAFFTVMAADKDGNYSEYYTRDGAFTKGPDGSLLTKDGFSVMGEKGPVKLDSGEFTVKEDGTVVQNGKVIDKLLITEFTDTSSVQKYGNNLVKAGKNAVTQEFSGNIQQGFIELSNVNIIKEMVDMITVTRSYEANQKVLQAQDGTLEKAVNEVGAVR